MGREIKRVPLDFDHPHDEVWPGFLNPYHSKPCPACDGSGYSPAAQSISDDWYDFDRTGRRWCNDITQDEADALVAKERLWNLTSRRSREEGWVLRTDRGPVTAAEVNEWSRSSRMGHDSINASICLEARCKRLGITRFCAVCEGHGRAWSSPELKQLHEAWKPSEPPTGDGWQVWETVSEGSPISPVFATPEELAKHLSAQGDDWDVKRLADGRSDMVRLPTYEQALAFVRSGWVPSMVMIDGVLTTGVAVAAALEGA